MTPEDAGFLHMEDDVGIMHSLSLATFDGPGPRFADLFDLVSHQASVVPRFRQRVVRVPFELGRPVWIDDPNFRIEYHCRHTAVPPGGDERDVRRLISRIASQRLDRNKPLWELWMISGLPAGMWGLLSKVHHSAVDGVFGTDPLTALFQPVGPEPVQHLADAVPTPAHLVRDAVTDLATQPGESVRALRASFREPIRALRRALQPDLSGSPEAAGRLTGPVGPHRRWAAARVPLADLRAIRDRHGGSVNDVVLAIVASGFRDLLRSRNRRKVASIDALIPLATSFDDDYGTEVTALTATLPIADPDPLARLRSIQHETAQAAESVEAIAGGVMAEIEGLMAPTICSLGIRAASRAGAARRRADTMIVNVPGPRAPMELLGRPLREILPIVALPPPLRIGLAAISYGGELAIGITGDYDTASDIGVLAEGIEKATTELSGLTV